MSDTQLRTARFDSVQTTAYVADAAWRRGMRMVVEILREQMWFISIMLGYLAAGFAIGRAYGQEIELYLYSGPARTLYFWCAFIIVNARIGWILVRHRPKRPLHFIWADLRQFLFDPRRILGAVPAFFLMPCVLSMTTSIKRMIPMIHPFDWDQALTRLDMALHGGRHPWEILQPFLGDPLVTVVISQAYASPWYVSMVVIQFWYTFTTDPRRQRFLIAMVLAWILLGNGLAIAFSSVGPCYYQYFVDGPNPYAPLMAYLGTVAESHVLVSARAQEYLWSIHETDLLYPGAGISAMPSMHVSMGTLFVLGTWHVHKSLRVLTILFLIVLQVGSVHLGWHYAIDGYVGIAGTLIIWWAVGRALAWRGRSEDATSNNYE